MPLLSLYLSSWPAMWDGPSHQAILGFSFPICKAGGTSDAYVEHQRAEGCWKHDKDCTHNEAVSASQGLGQVSPRSCHLDSGSDYSYELCAGLVFSFCILFPDPDEIIISLCFLNVLRNLKGGNKCLLKRREEKAGPVGWLGQFRKHWWSCLCVSCLAQKEQ